MLGLSAPGGAGTPVPLPYLSSYDWMEYVLSAWMVTHGVDIGGLCHMAELLYPAILGRPRWFDDLQRRRVAGSGERMHEPGGLLCRTRARALASPWAGFLPPLRCP